MQSLSRNFRRVFAAVMLLLALAYIFPFSLSAADKKKFVVVIDAGHGGSDHGAIENGVNEKDITLAVALKLGNLIKKKLKDTEVVYTRTTDSFISLQKRAEISNNAKADLFVSVHCNSVDRSNKNRANVTGATTYVLGHHKDGDNMAVAQRENAVVELDADDKTRYTGYDPESDESHIIFEMTQKKNFQNSIRFAVEVQREMEAIGRVSRGVQQAGFWVLWSTAAPAALIELDFLCNPQQAQYLASKEGQDKLSEAIFNAVKSYERYYRMSLGMAAADTQKAEARAAAAQERDREEVPADEEKAVKKDRPAAAMAELPSAPSDNERREHRAVAATPKKAGSSSHRRRSSAARAEGASAVEETVIAIVSEPVARSVDASEEDFDIAPGKDKAKESGASKGKKETVKEDKKKGGSAPGRRDKGKKTARKGVKQSVNVDYRILLFVSDEELKAGDEAFKGLTRVATFRENNQYKYTYGESSERKEMEELLKDISLLFPDARVIKCYY